METLLIVLDKRIVHIQVRYSYWCLGGGGASFMFFTDSVRLSCRHRLELMRAIYNDDLSPDTPEAKQDFFHCLSGCGNQNYFNFVNLIPSRLVSRLVKWLLLYALTRHNFLSLPLVYCCIVAFLQCQKLWSNFSFYYFLTLIKHFSFEFFIKQHIISIYLCIFCLYIHTEEYFLLLSLSL